MHHFADAIELCACVFAVEFGKEKLACLEQWWVTNSLKLVLYPPYDCESDSAVLAFATVPPTQSWLGLKRLIPEQKHSLKRPSAASIAARHRFQYSPIFESILTQWIANDERAYPTQHSLSRRADLQRA